MTNQNTFQVTEHGGIDPAAESPRFVAKHLSAYSFVKPFTRGRALEVGFGDGYGTFLLSQTAEEVVGIDLFGKNVESASEKYKKSNLKFMEMNATELTFPDRDFDLIVSFQVIEHIPQALLGRYLSEMRRVVKKDGAVCLSTLNLKKNLKPGQPYDKMPHHDKEFLPSEFQELLKSHFNEVAVYGLYPTLPHAFFERLKKSGLTKGLPRVIDPVCRFYDNITTDDFRWEKRNNLDGCIDLLGVCRN